MSAPPAPGRVLALHLEQPPARRPRPAGGAPRRPRGGRRGPALARAQRVADLRGLIALYESRLAEFYRRLEALER